MSTSPSSSAMDISEETGFLSEKPSQSRRVSATRDYKFVLACILNACFFTVSSLLFGTWYYNTHIVLNAELRRASSFNLDMRVETMNGTLFTPANEPSIARQMPNPEADAIWEEYELTRYIAITGDQIRAMGKDPSTVAKLEDEDWGLGDDMYASIMDVYHQLHCLNSLRQLVYPEYYSNETHSHGHHKKKDMFAIHVNHCVDILMQGIQCSGNVNLITMHWVATQEYPFPDMSVDRQCINFDKLTQWRKDSSIDIDKYVDKMKKKDGVTELPAPDKYYEHYLPDVVNPNHLNGDNPNNDFNL